MRTPTGSWRRAMLKSPCSAGPDPLFIGAVGVLNIVNTVFTNIHTRLSEIGVQRAIGMSTGDLYRTFLWEGLLRAAAAARWCRRLRVHRPGTGRRHRYAAMGPLPRRPRASGRRSVSARLPAGHLRAPAQRGANGPCDRHCRRGMRKGAFFSNFLLHFPPDSANISFTC